MAAVDGQYADVLERLRVLEDERAVLRTLHRYAHCIDYGLEAEWVDLFTEDGVFDVRRMKDGTGPPHRESGRDQLRRYIAQHTRAPAKYHKHFMVEPAIRVDGDEATVECYFTRLDEREGGPFVLAFGRYRDRLVKSADGRWRFRERIVEVEARSGD